MYQNGISNMNGHILGASAPSLSYSSRATVNFSMAPISTAMPTARDQRETQNIMNLLHQYHSYPPREESIQREEVLGKMDGIVREWVKQMGMNLGYSEQMAIDAGAKLVTFGSYRLGVHGPGADIDTLCIAPKHVTRGNFFDHLREMLLARPETSELTAVRETHVPVMKLIFDGIHIDLLFAQLDMGTIPEDLDVLDYNNLRNVDDETQRSLNGPRVADEILRLVPNVDNFRTTLRCVKLWASKRAVYGNVVGYPGGIAWALLVAKICQLYPNALPNTLLSRFFWIYQNWNWPNPILLKPIEEGHLHFKVWNPRIHPKDTNDRMPIITPAYPSMNSTYNVSNSTLRVMKHEFSRGYEITLKADDGKESWESLFEETEFFVLYKNYLQMQVSADNEEDHRAWVGYMESRLRHLILSVEKHHFLRNTTLLHPYPGYFPDPDAPIPTVYFYIGLDYQNRYQRTSGPAELDLTPAVNNFYARQVDSYAQRKETQHKPIITPVKRSQIPSFVISEEKRKALSKKHRRMLKRKRAEVEALAQQQQRQQEEEQQASTATATTTAEDTQKIPRHEDIETASSVTETSTVTENTSKQVVVLDAEESQHSTTSEEAVIPPLPQGQNHVPDISSTAVAAAAPITATISTTNVAPASVLPPTSETDNPTTSTIASTTEEVKQTKVTETSTLETPTTSTPIAETQPSTDVVPLVPSTEEEKQSVGTKVTEKKRKRKQQLATDDTDEDLLLGIPTISEDDASPNKKVKTTATTASTKTKTATKKKGLKMRLSM